MDLDCSSLVVALEVLKDGPLKKSVDIHTRAPHDAL